MVDASKKREVGLYRLFMIFACRNTELRCGKRARGRGQLAEGGSQEKAQRWIAKVLL